MNTENQSIKTTKAEEPDYIKKDKANLAAQLFQEAYINGKINETVYRNILNDLKDSIDISKFAWYNIYNTP